MSVLYILVPLALLVVLVAIGAYVWAVRHGQFDDTETPAIRMLHDDGGDAAGAPRTSTSPRSGSGSSSETDRSSR